MKRIMIVSVFAISLGLAVPQTNAMQRQTQPELSVVQGDDVKYEEITVDQVPEKVNTTFKTDYAGYKVDKAYKGDDGSFKLKVSNGTEKDVLVYDKDGKFVKTMKSDSSKMHDDSSEK